MASQTRREKKALKKPAWKIEGNVKLASGAALLIGTIAVGVWSFEARYAKAEEMDKKFNALQNTIVQGQQRSERRAIEAEKRSLQREQFDYLNTQQKRKLSDIESQRLKVVGEEIGRLDAEIKVLVNAEIKGAEKK